MPYSARTMATLSVRIFLSPLLRDRNKKKNRERTKIRKFGENIETMDKENCTAQDVLADIFGPTCTVDSPPKRTKRKGNYYFLYFL